MSSRRPGSYRATGRAARHREAGFTLLEIMVAMVMLGLIVTTAFGALRLGERSWEAGLARSGDTETLRAVSGLLQRQLNQALPQTWSEGKKTRIAFSGTDHALRFIAPSPSRHAASGLYEYTLSGEPQADGAALVLHYQLHDPGDAGFQPDDSQGTRVSLVAGLQSVDFAYFGSPSNDDPPRWHAYWSDSSQGLPRLVRARLVSRPDEQAWPDLLLSLAAEPTS